jgi:hypothetical protein
MKLKPKGGSIPNPKKLLVALAVLFALGATMSVFAELNGHWAGTGRGEWTCFNTFVDPPREIVMGPFDMTFNYVEEVCEGRWWTPDGAVPGSMRG